MSPSNIVWKKGEEGWQHGMGIGESRFMASTPWQDWQPPNHQANTRSPGDHTSVPDHHWCDISTLGTLGTQIAAESSQPKSVQTYNLRQKQPYNTAPTMYPMPCQFVNELLECMHISDVFGLESNLDCSMNLGQDSRAIGWSCISPEISEYWRFQPFCAVSHSLTASINMCIPKRGGYKPSQGSEKSGLASRPLPPNCFYKCKF